jgi:hypothetical protein
MMIDPAKIDMLPFDLASRFRDGCSGKTTMRFVDGQL